MKNPVKKSLLVLLAAFSGIVLPLRADDDSASRIYSEGRELYLQGEYYDAAKKFESVRFESRNLTIRANSLLAQMAAWRMCKLYYREFQIIEELLERYPEYVNCNELIAREFEIGSLFRGGYREPAFWVFRWIPYLVDVDRTAEVYNAALKRAPYSKFASAAHMDLAIHYEFDGKTAESIAQLRLILERHENSPEAKYALLGLANGLFALSGRGDGDSRYINESVELFKRFCRKYPEAPEIEFARNRLAQAKDVQAAKLFEIAEFYRKSGRSEVAERYLAQLMSDYPDSRTAPEAEETLLNISDNYLPALPPEKNEARLPDIRSYKIPADADILLVSPEEKNSPYLLEVPDLKIGTDKNVSGKTSEGVEK